MPIQVTCPGCLSRFTVSEKFAGKTGPCPKCKKEITIPDKSQEVVIHAPEESGPKDATGKSILKPIRREDVQLSPLQLGLAIASAVAVLVGAIVVRFTMTSPPLPLILVGLIGLAPPLSFIGYTFLRDGELAGYAGKELWLRILVCTAVFPATWGVYVFLSRYFENPTLGDTPIIQLSMFVTAMAAIGTFTALAVFELEMGQAFLHYVLYFTVTVVLALILGIELGEPFKKASTEGASPAATGHDPAASNPSVPAGSP